MYEDESAELAVVVFKLGFTLIFWGRLLWLLVRYIIRCEGKIVRHVFGNLSEQSW